jgi:hypothetical protein
VDQGPLVTEQIDAGEELLARFQQYKPVSAAFWLRESETPWYLYLASDQIDDTNFDLAYGEVVKLLDARSRLWLDPMQVKVRGTSDPVVQSIVSLQQKFPAPHPTRLHHRLLGGRSVEEAYIYPLPAAAAG